MPAPLVYVVEERARGVRGLRGVDLAARQAMEQPRVDRTEGERAVLGPSLRIFIGSVIKDPADLRAGEVGIEEQAGARAGERGPRRRAPRRAQTRAPPRA